MHKGNDSGGPKGEAKATDASRTVVRAGAWPLGSAGDAEALAAQLTQAGENVYRIGRVLPRPAEMPGALVQGMTAAWHG